MSLDVAIQSVIFYVLSCSTCAKISHRRKAKVQAKKDRAEKEELETQQPGLYRHPSPFSTNPYWEEEIVMGPHLVKKHASKNASQQALSGEQGSIRTGSTALGSEAPSSPTAVTDDSRMSGDGWNRKRYQREDELLWGLDFQGPTQKIKDAFVKAGSSASRLLESKLKSGDAVKEEEDEEDEGTYYMHRNPPVNDLHPPIVSTQPKNRDETRWMLQPPPSAKIMEGKERVNRNRADSNGSSRKGAEGAPLSRVLTDKLVDAKIQRGETPYLDGRSAPPRQIKTPTSNRPKSQRHDRQRSSSNSSSSSGHATKKKRRPPPISISTSARSSIDSIENPLPSRSSTHPRSAGSETAKDSSKRPNLPTITSSSNVVPQIGKDKEPLSELSTPSQNSQSPHSRRLSANANAMPASIPSKESKFPGASTFRFPRPASTENVSLTP